MRMKMVVSVGSVLLFASAWMPAGAQAVYRCGSGVYSQQPCSKQIVSTDEAVASVKPRAQEQRVAARSLRRLPGEAEDEFALRQRRAGLQATDQDECARLDKRIPVEKMRLNSPYPDTVFEAEASLRAASQRYQALGC